MKVIKLYGHLGRQFGKIHKYAVNTPAEAIRLLSINYKGFEEALLKFNGLGYKIFLGKENIGLEDYHIVTGSDTIKIVPVISGAGDSNLNMIILGAALVMFAPWAAGTLSLALETSSLAVSGGVYDAIAFASAAAVNLGGALILGGVAGMLFSPPQTNATNAKTSTDGYFSGPLNTTRQGYPVPVGYGKLMVGSAVISAGFVSEKVPV
jgi:predicted phage tail protein